MGRFLRIVLLSAILAVVGMVGAQGNVLTCTGEVPPQIACTYERVDWRVLGLDSTVGVTGQLDFRGAFTGLSEPVSLSLTPFAAFSWYEPNRAYWIEFAVPEGLVPVIGNSPYALQVGMEIRW